MFQERVVRVRLAVEQDLAEAKQGFLQALQPEAPNTFVWHEEEFWVDRVRLLVVPVHNVRKWRSGTTLADDGEVGEARSVLEVFGGPSRLEDTGHILTLFAWLLCGVQRQHPWTGTAAHVLNLVVAQPVVNPAFQSLLWLALAYDIGPRGQNENVYDLVGPMTYETMHFPERTPSAADVRRAQIAFLEMISPSVDLQRAQELSEPAWVQRCDAQARHHQALVNENVFGELLSRLGPVSRESGARPFP